MATTTFPCPTCGREFASARALLGHTAHHGTRSALAQPCPDCGRPFTSKNMARHLRSHGAPAPDKLPPLPDGANPLACRFCGREFASPGGRAVHEAVSHATPQPCPVCGLEQRNPQGMAAHVKNKHPEFWYANGGRMGTAEHAAQHARRVARRNGAAVPRNGHTVTTVADVVDAPTRLPVAASTMPVARRSNVGRVRVQPLDSRRVVEAVASQVFPGGLVPVVHIWHLFDWSAATATFMESLRDE